MNTIKKIKKAILSYYDSHKSVIIKYKPISICIAILYLLWNDLYIRAVISSIGLIFILLWKHGFIQKYLLNFLSIFIDKDKTIKYIEDRLSDADNFNWEWKQEHPIFKRVFFSYINYIILGVFLLNCIGLKLVDLNIIIGAYLFSVLTRYLFDIKIVCNNIFRFAIWVPDGSGEWIWWVKPSPDKLEQASRVIKSPIGVVAISTVSAGMSFAVSSGVWAQSGPPTEWKNLIIRYHPGLDNQEYQNLDIKEAITNIKLWEGDAYDPSMVNKEGTFTPDVHKVRKCCNQKGILMGPSLQTPSERAFGQTFGQDPGVFNQDYTKLDNLIKSDLLDNLEPILSNKK